MPKKVTLKVQPRTGFDKSFQNMLTLKCGTLVPLLIDEVIPNTTVNLKASISASLPPLASDTFMRVQLRTEAFFVPFRLIYGGYQSWQTRQAFGPSASARVASMPCCDFVPTGFGVPGSLADYLGIKINGNNQYPSSRTYSLLPFIAYHRIYDDWYRNPIIQRPLFTPFMQATSRGYQYVEHLPYNAFPTGGFTGITSLARLTFDDGFTLFDLRQRNFDDDYYTTCKPSQQLGTRQAVSVPVVDSNGSFTISNLRAANSIQQYLERNNILGYRLQDYVKGQYGADLSDGVAQRVLYLGSNSFDVYSKGIYQSTPDLAASSSRNPFNSVGARYGSAVAGGTGNLIDHFTANESGYIFVMASLVPKVTYSSGISPMFRRYIAGSSSVDDRSDMANPILQNIGNQQVYTSEIAPSASVDKIFGYTDRYAAFMQRSDELHGLLRDGMSLQSFALQRNFDNPDATDPDSVEISSSFLQIPTNYLDQVAAVADSVSDYGCWVDSWLDYKVVQPLARYSIPSLQNPAVEHGNSVVVTDGGSRI